MITISLFGKQNCGKCQASKKKVPFFVEKWGFPAGHIKFVYHDLETVDGRAEAAFQDVGDKIPVILVENGEHAVARWDGETPQSNELLVCLESALGPAPNRSANVA